MFGVVTNEALSGKWKQLMAPVSYDSQLNASEPINLRILAETPTNFEYPWIV